MDRSYRLGILIVVTTVFVSALLCLAYSAIGRSAPAPAARAAEDVEDAGLELGAFRLTERSGRAIGDADLAGRVWVASFIFTHCPLSCPRITSVMKGLQAKLAGTNVQLVSISVDPDRDTPQVLTAYARTFAADPDRWWFLTASRDDLLRLIRERFKLGLALATESEQQAGAESILHSDRLVLVDRGNRIVAYFDSTDPAKIAALAAEASRRDRRGAAWVRRLPLVNASLNGTCTLLLILGWRLIRTGNVRAHATVMILAVATSAVFLASYLVYHYQAGSTHFRGVGLLQVVYFTILLSHTFLATVGVVPLLVLTLTRAARRQFEQHARIAKVTLPIWLYVSITGVVVYLMLYQMPVSRATGDPAGHMVASGFAKEPPDPSPQNLSPSERRRSGTAGHMVAFRSAKGLPDPSGQNLWRSERRPSGTTGVIRVESNHTTANRQEGQ